MSLYNDILQGRKKICVIGLGYIGLPLATAFAKKVKVIGFDLNEKKIALYKSGIDPTGEVGDEEIKNTAVEFTADAARIKRGEISHSCRADAGESGSHAQPFAGRGRKPHCRAKSQARIDSRIRVDGIPWRDTGRVCADTRARVGLALRHGFQGGLFTRAY